MTIQDSQKEALISQGFSGSVNEMMIDWAQDNGAVSDQYNKAIIEVLQNKGITDSNQPNTAWKEYLVFLGYSGALPSQMKEFWEEGGLAVLANETFTDTNGTNLSAHTSDSGHSWSVIAGQVDIQSNIADVIITPHHYVLNSFIKQPKKITIDLKDTLALRQTAAITLRDTGDGLNYVLISLTAESFGTTLAITEVVAGIPSVKDTTLVFGDLRNNTDFFEVIITDDGINTIFVDATAIDSGLTALWSAAGIPTNNGVGVTNTATLNTTTLYDNLIVRG